MEPDWKECIAIFPGSFDVSTSEGRVQICRTDTKATKAVNREDKRSRRYRDRDFAKFERSRRYRDR